MWLQRLKWLLKYTFLRRTIKSLLVFGLIGALIWISGIVLEKLPFFGVIKTEVQAASDLKLNDLHYSLAKRLEAKESMPNFLLINTGDLSKDSFRLELANLIEYIQFLEPKAIGIDHDFSADTNLIGTHALVSALTGKSNIVLGKNDEALDSTRIEIPNATYGIVNFAEHYHTVRHYATHSETFAAKLGKLNGVNPNSNAKRENFVIHYVIQDYVPLAFERESLNNFIFSQAAAFTMPVFNSKEVMDSDDLEFAHEMIAGKTILIGHCGSTSLRDFKNDLEDKFAVPCDTNLLFRQKTMPGLLLHANALFTVLHPEHSFWVLSDEGWFKLLNFLMLLSYVFFLLYARAGKLINIALMLALSFPYLFMVLYLMQHGVYIEMGGTLLHLLIFEELIEIFEPAIVKIERRIKSKFSL